MQGFARDLILGLRMLRRRPGFSLLTIGMLALGIGGTITVFTLVNGVLLESVPYPDSNRLVTLDVTRVSTGFDISLSNPNYEDWRDRNRSFSEFGGSAARSMVMPTDGGAERLVGRMVIGDFFAVLGMRPSIGRVFDGDETGPGAPALAVLGHELWERSFGSDPSAVGSSVTLDNRPHTIVGVLEPGVGYPDGSVDLYLPMGAYVDELPWNTRGSSFGTRAVARLQDGISVAQAQEDMNRVTDEVDALEGELQVTSTVRTLDDFFLGELKPTLWTLLGAVFVLLLIAGANVTNLSLAGAETRHGELAVRRALGAGRGQIVRLLIAQWLWLGLSGGAVGLALADLALTYAPGFLPIEIPELVTGQIGLDVRVLAFAVVLTATCGLLFGLLPSLGAVAASRLKDGVRSIGRPTDRRLRDGLVVVQVALSVILLVGAGLLLQSFGRLASVQKGFDEEDVLTALVAIPEGTVSSHQEWLALYDGIVGELAASPDVQSAAATNLIPLSGRSWERRIRSELGPEDPQDEPSVLYNLVSEGYFETMGIPLVAGRVFGPEDGPEAPLVAVIDQTMAELFWPAEDPIGERVRFRFVDEEPVWHTVIGVVANLRHYELESPSRVQVYESMRQTPAQTGLALRVLAKTRGDPALTTNLLRRTVADLEPSAPVAEVAMLDEYVNGALGTERAMASLTVALGALAALLAGLGLFAVLSLAVARRTREIGLRMAVGATSGAVVGLVARRALAMVLVGLAAGIVVSAGAGQVIEAFLYQVRPWDVRIYLAAGILLLIVAGISVVGPALRASALSPSRVLREE